MFEILRKVVYQSVGSFCIKPCTPPFCQEREIDYHQFKNHGYMASWL